MVDLASDTHLELAVRARMIKEVLGEREREAGGLNLAHGPLRASHLSGPQLHQPSRHSTPSSRALGNASFNRDLQPGSRRCNISSNLVPVRIQMPVRSPCHVVAHGKLRDHACKCWFAFYQGQGFVKSEPEVLNAQTNSRRESKEQLVGIHGSEAELNLHNRCLLPVSSA